MTIPRIGVLDEQTFQVVALHVRPPGVRLPAS
jgi:hypothetical protein